MGKSEPVVHIVDDDEAVLNSLQLLLNSVGLETETYTTGNDFLHSFEHTRPGCVILDIRLPGISGMEVFQKLRQRKIAIPVIFLTGYPDMTAAVDAMKSGARDFLLKPFREQGLLDSVQTAIAEDRRHLERRARQSMIAARLDSLSNREQEILDQLLQGLSRKEIANRLHISIKTVDFHRASIMRKTETETMAELFLVLLKGGYTPLKE